ncbi:anthranilate synthase [Idiomarina sp. WRN-38]|uniref:anthranilate synthase component 1 n=1 Tax=Idiomarina sp. OXR-189 TaxID=3100175 RepID=UPI000733868B|nr:anthranilate synthase component 1 [Idiomarina sp. OXR-189]KTG23282.1 anthranilate synthase [Idiomarina sp. H105]OAE90675.1 anthranilate synthase [Idiomarina sp. WRN-38]WPZ00570.1 anthranilate synthase component 1 [Idiomarina sp. OXR-189]
MDNLTTEQDGNLETLRVSLPYQAEPLQVYQNTCQTNGANLLLDSADIGTKQQVKSLLLIDAALQLTCNEQQVTIQALTDNGNALLPWIQKKLESCASITALGNGLVADFTLTTPSQGDVPVDEDSRLRQISNMEPLRILQQQLMKANDTAQQHPFSVFLGGAFAYDFVASYEPLPQVEEGENDCPDYVFYLAETLLIIDHQAQTTELLGSVFGGKDHDKRYQAMSQRVGELAARCQLPAITPEPLPVDVSVTATPSADEFASIVTQLKKNIVAGDIFQVVPSRRFKMPCPEPLAAYNQLKKNNPSPYMFFMSHPDFCLFGASPESALKYQKGSNQVELYPIAGTRPRGKNADGSINLDLDSRMELELRLDQKELAEHLMLVDLARNDLARISETGSRYVADLLQVDRYSQVMHLVSRVVAKLRDDCDALHAYRACMNMGTLVGAPKVSAATLIRQVEKQRRGSYGGAVGYLAGNGDMDTCIVIRSAFVKNGEAIVQAGAGVVHDSNPDSEVAETESKAKAVILAIQQAHSVQASTVQHSTVQQGVQS